MSFAYIQGQESEALAYFERLLNQPMSEADRAQLEDLVRDLRRKVELEKRSGETTEPAMHNARSLNLRTK